MSRLIRRRLVPFVKRPHITLQKYFRIYVLREIFPLYGENYDENWGRVSYKDKTVLDLGADYGSTAYYFLKKGAKRIIAVEGDKSLALKLVHNYGKDARVTCVQKWINGSEDIEELIKLYPSDLVKVDIEGAEKHIAYIPSETLLSINEWLIEVHTKGIYDELSKVFLKLGFKVFAFDIVGVYKILYARAYSHLRKEP